MASPAARLLVTGVNDPGSVFAFFGKVGRSPRVFAARDRDSLLRELQAAALKKMGLTVAGVRVTFPRVWRSQVAFRACISSMLVQHKYLRVTEKTVSVAPELSLVHGRCVVNMTSERGWT